MKKSSPKQPAMLRKIAFVADGNYGNISRYATGFSELANYKNGYISREFLVNRDSQQTYCNGKLPKEFFAWQPDAIVYSGTDQYIDLFQPFIEKQIPVITLNRLPRNDLPIVLSDIHENYELVYTHFGNRVAAMSLFVEGDSATHGPITVAYQAFTERHQIPCSIYRYEETGPLEQIRNLKSINRDFRDWLHAQPKPLGLYTNTTHLGLFLRLSCGLAKLRVPQDVMIIGIDDFDIANETEPSITSVRLPCEAMGAKAVELIRDQLEHKVQIPLITRVSGASIIGRRSTGYENTKEWDLDGALEFIERHALEDIKVDDILSHTQSIARETFQRKFVASTGITPRRALEQRRMREARRLLLETEMSPSWIAGMCGYPDYNHFYKAFRNVNGISPEKYRNSSESSS